MAYELPTVKSKVESYNPKMIILFGKPKSGKSTLVASIDNNLIVDLEDGYRSLSVLKVLPKKASNIFGYAEAIKKKNAELVKNNEGKYFYRFITIDNVTRLEEMAIPYAAHLYRSTPQGKNWGYVTDEKGIIKMDKNNKPIIDANADVRKMPNGAGYQYLREAVNQLIGCFDGLCETLILVGHVKEKQIRVNSEEMSEMSLDLAGKIADITCGKADAVGYIYREGNKTIISFEGGDNTIKEARPLHLRGKKFVVAESDDENNLTINMNQIFLPESEITNTITV